MLYNRYLSVVVNRYILFKVTETGHNNFFEDYIIIFFILDYYAFGLMVLLRLVKLALLSRP